MQTAMSNAFAVLKQNAETLETLKKEHVEAKARVLEAKRAGKRADHLQALADAIGEARDATERLVIDAIEATRDLWNSLYGEKAAPEEITREDVADARAEYFSKRPWLSDSSWLDDDDRIPEGK